MGLFRQQAMNTQRPSVIGELIIPPSQWIGRTVAGALLCFVMVSAWTLTRQYQQTHAVRGITQYTQGEYAIVNQHLGEVTDIYVQPNEVVKQGQALFSLSHIASARFSKADLDAQVLQYQALHHQLKNKQKELQNAFAAEAHFVHTSRSNTQQLIDNLSEQAQIFTPELASLQTQFEKMTHLMKQKVVTNPQWIQAGSQLSAAKANMLRFDQEKIQQQSQLALYTQQLALIRLKYAAQQDSLQAQITQNTAVGGLAEKPLWAVVGRQPVRPQPNHLQDPTDSALLDQKSGVLGSLVLHALAVTHRILAACRGHHLPDCLKLIQRGEGTFIREVIFIGLQHANTDTRSQVRNGGCRYEVHVGRL